MLQQNQQHREGSLPVSSSSYHQEDCTGASEPTPPDCSTAFFPQAVRALNSNHPDPLWNLMQTPTSWNMADSVYGVMCVSGLLMSMLWIEWPMVVVGLWYGQVYVMDNEHGCILLMAFWIHRDTVTRSWGPLLCHSSMTITSCCSMIMHGPMLQGSVHNSWKLKTSQFWPAYALDISPIEHVWDALDRHIRQRVPVPANPATSHSHWRGVDQHSTGHNQQPDQLCEGDVLHCVRQMVVTPDTDWFSDPPGPPPIQ